MNGMASAAPPWRIGRMLSAQARAARRAGVPARDIFFQPVEALSGKNPLLAVAVGVWLMRPDLQAAFDLDSAEGQARFLAWQLDYGVREYAVLREVFAREDVRALYLGTPAGAAAPETPLAPTGGVNLVGHLHARLGIGEDARCAAAALTAAAIPHALIDAPAGADIGTEPHAFAAEIVAAPVHATNLLFLSAWETFRYFCVHGSSLWRGRKTICVWPWELPQWPEPLEFCTLLADEIWAISSFVRNAFELRSPVPVIAMPSAVMAAAAADRAAYGLPGDAFVFVCFFDGNSSFARKNPAAAIAAFRTAFPLPDLSVRLVVKAMRAGASGQAWRELQDSAGGDPRIAFVDEEWSRAETLGLLASCDCLVSLHRAEGFGRPIAEALLLRRPVVATRWSGNLDFRDSGLQLLVEAALRPVPAGAYLWGEGQVWAEPDPAAAADALRVAARLRPGAAPPAGAVFDPATVGARYRARLEALGALGG
jgi:glycosyltransferase involved in cell wall biosynthesis